MDKKLTLSLDHSIIEQAKIYAKKHNISVSKLIETYLKSITTQTTSPEKSEVSPLVNSLTGVINLDDDFDESIDYKNYLKSKYE